MSDLLWAAGALQNGGDRGGKCSGGLCIFAMYQESTVPIELDPAALVSDLLREACEAFKLDPRSSTVSFQGTKLMPEDALADAGVGQEVVVHISARSAFKWDSQTKGGSAKVEDDDLVAKGGEQDYVRTDTAMVPPGVYTWGIRCITKGNWYYGVCKQSRFEQGRETHTGGDEHGFLFDGNANRVLNGLAVNGADADMAAPTLLKEGGTMAFRMDMGKGELRYAHVDADSKVPEDPKWEVAFHSLDVEAAGPLYPCCLLDPGTGCRIVLI
eukprot:Hpha_TRINITY_DN32011_c0_g1::TRINITY_DN32011_c0_g1_i1::g.115826::m.115826